MKKNLLFTIVVFSFLFTGCGASKNKKSKSVNKEKTTKETVLSKSKELSKENSEKVIIIPKSNTSKNLTTKKYIEKYAGIAVKEMQTHNIPASITLAQGILESSSGNSSLTKVSNNHFGIKCHKNWQGKRTYYDDDKKGECFRVYDEPEKSFDDHSDFLTSRKRYAELFKLKKTDYKSWARGLKSAGYATDPKYPQKLIGLIEKYELYKYDTSNVIDTYKVVKGDNLYNISKRYNLKVKDLMKYNNLKSYTIKIGQVLKLNHATYVASSDRKKKSKKVKEIKSKNISSKKPKIITSVTNKDVYVVEQGDNLYRIAKRFKVKVKDLMKYNHLDSYNINVGDILQLKEVVYSKKTEISQKQQENNLETKIIDKKEIKEKQIQETYIVVQGDNLYKISQRFNLSLQDLLKYNNMRPRDLKVGQVLRLTQTGKPLVEIPADNHDMASKNHIVHKTLENTTDKNVEVTQEDTSLALVKTDTKKSVPKSKAVDVVNKVKPTEKKKQVKNKPIVTKQQKSSTRIVKPANTKLVDNEKNTIKKTNITTTTKTPKPLVKTTVINTSKSKVSTKKVVTVPITKKKETTKIYKKTKKTNQKPLTTTIIIDNKPKKTSKIPSYHIVKKGETLYSIAYKYGLEIPKLRRWNNIYKNEIRIGQKIILKDVKHVVAAERSRDIHVVGQGDTLYKIATKYSISVADIKRINGLKSSTIYIGQKLKVRVEGYNK